MTNKRTINAVKGKQGFQHRTHHEPKTSNLVSQDLETVALDSRQQERLGLFLSKFGDKEFGSTDDLEALGIYHTLPEQLKVGVFALADNADVHPDCPVFVRQTALSKSRVLEYIDMMNSGDSIAAIQVTDLPPGGGHWHLNGLHRLAAARILGHSIRAEIWR